MAIVRGSTHPGHGAHLDGRRTSRCSTPTTRVGQRSDLGPPPPARATPRWRTSGAASRSSPRDEWRSPDELLTHLHGWLADTARPTGRGDWTAGWAATSSFGHGGLLRRPLRGAWSGQGAPGYRAAAAVLPDRAVPTTRCCEAVRLHVASYGPASRHDVAWWSGLGLRQVDALLERLDPVWRDGPDGRAYADLAARAAARRGARRTPAAGVRRGAVRLRPEGARPLRRPPPTTTCCGTAPTA